eukprot:scaffold53675_cov84-Phaeocystis_antarctica.AAC.2
MTPMCLKTGFYVPEDGLPRGVAAWALRACSCDAPCRRRPRRRRQAKAVHAEASLPLTRGELRQLARQLLHLLRVGAGDDQLAGRTTLQCPRSLPRAGRQHGVRAAADLDLLQRARERRRR